MDLEFYREELEKSGVVFEPGLEDSEVLRVESRFKFEFPPDLKEFLKFALPVSQWFPNWRNIDDPSIDRALSWPYESMCFDIRGNVFWLAEWGSKPESQEEAFQVAKLAIDDAPRLIPVYSHRYLPDRPCIAGNPVFSVYQTDIIYYGIDLWNYFDNEFGTREYHLNEPIRQIEFWSRLVERNC